MSQTLIQAEELARHLAPDTTASVYAGTLASDTRARDLLVLDCRFELPRPEWGTSAYAAGHIPSALYAHLERDLSGPVSSTTGRHPLPSVEAWSQTLGRWGVDEHVQVVAYDQGNGAYAARLWWMLRWVGHTRVAVLDGGFAAWQRAGLPIETQPATRVPRQFTPRPVTGALVTTAELLRSMPPLLVDARTADRFAGQNETIDPIAGHVPGARNHPFPTNLDSHGRFLPASDLRSHWEKTLRGHGPSELVAMCGSGVTACHNLLALEIAGLNGGRLYAGSWSEWIRDPTRPVATGSEPL